VVKTNAGYGGDNDRYLDLRVDDDPEPVRKLAILVNTHHLYFGSPKPEDAMPITEDVARELQWMMVEGGYLGGDINGVWDEMSQLAFSNLVGNENLEERWSKEKSPAMIDKVALGYLRNRFGKK
ncbi:MAG TPA: putative peptidoglycan binding domain-containing protein, partial [Aggregatilineales bacterium]|nr:putative peptidoglycan binding domain-containing protein [Aggregatilineales bacterium]